MNQYAVVISYLDAYKVYVFNDLFEARQGMKELYERCLKWTIKRNVFHPITICTNDYFEIKGSHDLMLGDNTIKGNVIHVSPLK